MSNPNIDLCLSLHLAYSRLRLLLDEELGTYHGIDLDDFALLRVLSTAGGDPTGLEILSAELGASRSTLLRRLRPLEKIGLVSYSGELTNRRVALRSPGHSLVQIAQDTIARVCEKASLAKSVKALQPDVTMY